MKVHQANHGKIRHPKPLTVDQRNAIDQLIIGKSDQETADAIGVSRQTVQVWRTSHLVFQSELEQARGALWRLSAERLRGMMSRALDNIVGAIEKGDVKASFELLKAVNLFGNPEINSIRDWRMTSLVKQAAEAQVKAEGIIENGTENILIDLSKNPAWRHRVEAIEAELWEQYGEP